MKKRILAAGMTIVLSMGLVACSDKPVVEDLSKVTLDDIAKYNNGTVLLDKYDSVKYYMEIYSEDGKYIEEADIGKVDGKYCYTVRLDDTESFRQETFKDGFIYSQYGETDGLEYSVCWCMDGEYDKYLQQCVEGFLVSDTSDLTITDFLEEDGFVSVTAQIDEGDNVQEEYDYFYEYVMDKVDLSVTQFVSYGVDQEGEESIGSFAEVTYDEEFKVPSYVKTLQDEKTRTVKIVVDPGKDSEKVQEVKIANTATFDALLSNGYNLYSDKEGKQIFNPGTEALGENGAYSDLTVYAIN